MGLDFDLKNFIEDMRACKPPYKCPFDHCGRVYKTFSGIHVHINSHSGDATPGTGDNGGRSPSPQPFFKSPIKESLVYNEASKMLEFEAEGRPHKFSIYDALELVSKEDWEATIPPQEEEPERPEEAPKTPIPSKAKVTKKGKSKKTPRSSLFGKSSSNKAETPKGDASDAKEAEKKPLKLPEAQYHEIDDYDLPPAPPMPENYIRFIEKPSEVQDEEVEYDMDEEDVAWLDIINKKRASENLNKIQEDQFELLMDRLEKESYFHVQTNGKDYNAPIDDDAICCVCMDGECSNTNVILFCDLCNLAVHQECYGVPYIPEGQWLCRRCLQSPSRSVDCCLCPNKGGAFKQTDDGRWAHVVCGLWIPEVRFANTVFLEPIDSIDNIPPARWKLSCRVCKQRGVGACIQCHKTNCYTAFHVTCGLLAGLHMKMDTVRESSATGLSVTVRKTAFCDTHTPMDSDCKPQLEDIAALGISTAKQKARSPKKLMDPTSPVPVLFRGLMNFSPQCPWDRVQEIANLIQVQRKNQFFQRLMAYWTLKRQTRNGVPLIRRLQFAKASSRPDKAPETPQKNAHHNQKKKERGELKVQKAKEEFKGLLEQRRMLRRLRQDLERVRLLCELIRKREQRKRELIVVQSTHTQIKLDPFNYFLLKLLDCLQEIDVQEIFAEPVSLDDVPDYLDHITKPMDFQTMRQKLDSHSYKTIDDLEADFALMVENCLSYNEKDTIYYRSGTKMRDQGGSIIRQARRMMDSIGFDLETGLHSAERGTSTAQNLSDDKLMKEIDKFVNDESRDDMPLEEHLKILLDLYDKAMLISHPVAKTKRMKLLKQEITKLRRKLSMDKAGTSPGFKPKFRDLTTGDETESNDENQKKKKKKRDESPPDIDLTETRRLRATGPKSASASTDKKQPGKRGRKRLKPLEGDTPSKRKKDEETTTQLKTPVKSVTTQSPAKSPAGVNRRNAVLFTRKKQAASSASTTPSADANAKEAKEPKEVVDDNTELETQETEVQSPAPVMPEPTEKPEKKKRGRKPKALKAMEAAKEAEKTESSPKKAITEQWRTGPDLGLARRGPDMSSSFREYRRGGEIAGETDEETHSESAGTDAVATSEEESSAADTDSDSETADTTSSIPLEPLDLVWAKCRGYPWYPALIINPKMPRTGYLHNGVPIPVPPQDVLDMAQSHASPHFLILFFDAKRTWQWLTRDKLEPLGVNSDLDKSKLVQSKKPSERKAVGGAYEEAILHRCRVTGENASVSEDGSSETENEQVTQKDG